MRPLRFAQPVGRIDVIPLSAYQDLVARYARHAQAVPGVLGVNLIGSFSTPGLSDIDLVVTVDQASPLPDWRDLSLRMLAVGHPAESVVAHDVIVLPLEIAQKVEAFFFVDAQTTLFGEKLGGRIDSTDVEAFETLLTFEYAFHRLEALMSLLLARRPNLRTILLFLSTLRHSARLAAGRGWVSEVFEQDFSESVAALRRDSLGATLSRSALDGWPERALALLWGILGQPAMATSGAVQGQRPRAWAVGPKTAAVATTEPDPVSIWRRAVAVQKRIFWSERARAVPVPAAVQLHLFGYISGKDQTSSALRAYLGLQSAERVTSPDRWQEYRRIRGGLILDHWRFLETGGYAASSGKGYLGLAQPPSGLRAHTLSILRDLSATVVGRGARPL